MNSNNINTAPQVDCVQHFYMMWNKKYSGSQIAFYEFMTTPSTERDEFINSLGDEAVYMFNRVVAETILRVKQ